ncbi:hypothetical protein NMG60_11025948 [Bertholletia excelsa]
MTWCPSGSQELKASSSVKSNQALVQRNNNVPQLRRVLDEKAKEIKDQLIRATAHLKFAQPTSNSQFIR